ncbi:MAG: peptidoglycan recognition protein family protein [Planctomycetota bacterium]|jgi:hypothetical protein
MMIAQSRQTRVLTALLVSITLGAIILNSLGRNPPPAGAFCLSKYYHLVPVEKTVLCREAQLVGRWKRIKIYYSGSDSRVTSIPEKSSEQLDSLSSVAGQEDNNCHFIICNGRIGHDGQILPTEKWQRQLPVNRQSLNQMQKASEKKHTIYICVIANGKTTSPTDFQIKRTEALVAELCRKFSILPESIYYPYDWQ